MQNHFLIAAQADGPNADMNKLRAFIVSNLHGQELWLGFWIVELGSDAEVIKGVLNPVRAGFKIFVCEITENRAYFGIPLPVYPLRQLPPGNGHTP